MGIECDHCGTDNFLGYETVVLCNPCASKLEELSTTAPNSDYATALKVYDEWHESTCDSDNLPFRGWLSQRLNASTHIA